MTSPRAIPRRFQLIKFHFLPGKAAFTTRPIPEPLVNCLRRWPATHLRRGQFHRDRRREIRIQTPVESHGERLSPLRPVTSKSRGENPRLSGLRRLSFRPFEERVSSPRFFSLKNSSGSSSSSDSRSLSDRFAAVEEGGRGQNRR